MACTCPAACSAPTAPPRTAASWPSASSRSPPTGPDRAHPPPGPHDGPVTNDRTRPDLDDTTVEGLGKLSEALETVEQARGLLYGFHQLTGKADLLLQDAVDLLRSAGHETLADALDRDLVGRNVVAD